MQENQAHFFDRLYSELAFSPATSAIQEIINSINFFLPTHLTLKNISSGETLEGSFFFEKNLLVYFQVTFRSKWTLFSSEFKAESGRSPTIILDLSYARLHTSNQKSGPLKIHLGKNKNSYEIIFHDENNYDDWMLKLRKICILTNFEEKYQITEVTKISRDRCVKRGFGRGFLTII